MNVATTYIRHFSEIGKIQKEKSIRYELLSEPEGYGIRVTLDTSGLTRSDCQAKITPSRDEAMALLMFLYENAIPIESWRDLTVDVMKSMRSVCC